MSIVRFRLTGLMVDLHFGGHKGLPRIGRRWTPARGTEGHRLTPGVEMSQRRQYQDPDNRPVVSVCTILILSGFLIGLATSNQVASDLRVYLYSSGFLGILSFLALDHVRNRRRLQAEAVEQMLVEERLERHVGSCTSLSDLRRDSKDFQDTEELDAIPEDSTAAMPVAS